MSYVRRTSDTLNIYYKNLHFITKQLTLNLNLINYNVKKISNVKQSTTTAVEAKLKKEKY